MSARLDFESLIKQQDQAAGKQVGKVNEQQAFWYCRRQSAQNTRHISDDRHPYGKFALSVPSLILPSRQDLLQGISQQRQDGQEDDRHDIISNPTEPLRLRPEQDAEGQKRHNGRECDDAHNFFHRSFFHPYPLPRAAPGAAAEPSSH